MATKINKSIYELTVGTIKFEIEKFPDGSWMLFQPEDFNREYIMDFRTKRDAMTYAEGYGRGICDTAKGFVS